MTPNFKIEPNELIQLTSSLVQINSENPPGDNLEIVGFIEEVIREWGIKVETQNVAEGMKKLPLYIADGHHRYETALNYGIQMRKGKEEFSGREACNYVMMYLSNMNDDGLVILPTHRLLRNLKGFDPDEFRKKIEKYFHVEEFEFDEGNELQVRKELFHRLVRNGRDKNAFSVYLNGARSYDLLTLRSEGLIDSGIMNETPSILRRLDVSVLQTFVLKDILGINDLNMECQNNVDFTDDGDEAIEMVKDGKYQLVFLMNHTKVNQVSEAGLAGVRMPQKSTFFYPKLLCGLVINSIRGTVDQV